MFQGLEKYLMTKIYYKTFAQSALDRERDVALSQRMTALSFVQPYHLDIPKHYQEDHASRLAIKELHKINNYKVWPGQKCPVLHAFRLHNDVCICCRHPGISWSASSIAVESSIICCMLLEMTAMKPEVSSKHVHGSVSRLLRLPAVHTSLQPVAHDKQSS